MEMFTGLIITGARCDTPERVLCALARACRAVLCTRVRADIDDPPEGEDGGTPDDDVFRLLMRF